MRRTKEWWARLTAEERSELHRLEDELAWGNVRDSLWSGDSRWRPLEAREMEERQRRRDALVAKAEEEP